ncbi:MAG: HAD family hydrolase [Beijerinckiaceae bacterium]
MTIKAEPTRVVFDIGNVLLCWDPRLLYRKIFPTEEQVEDFLRRVLPPEWNLEQDRGRSWAEAEAEKIALFPEYADAIRAFRARWHETIPGDIPETVSILKALKAAGVPLYAITNFASDTFREAQKRFPYLGDSFIDIVISGDEKLLKPDPTIYQVLLKRQQLEASDCVFIDDSKANVAAAAALGFHALVFTSPAQFGADLRRLGFDIPVALS